MEAVQELAVGVPETFAAAQLYWRNGDVHRVDQVGAEELADRGNTATEAHVFAVCGLLGSPQGFFGSGVEEVEGGVGQGERGTLVVE